MVSVEALTAEFVERFGGTPRVFSAPGRVNLIGEHTDYNDGFVLPMAIGRRCFVAGAATGGTRVRARSRNLDEDVEFDLLTPGPTRRGHWIDFVEGTARALIARGMPVTGVDLLIDSEVPAGAGVSASAALELALAYAFTKLAGATEPDGVQLALAGQAAEHEYVGTMCGIMDQYISALGRREHALLIDCRSLEATLIPLELGRAEVLVCDTRVKHDLASSAYNDRRRECEEAVRRLSEFIPGIRALRDVSPEQFANLSHHLPDVVQRRARHVVGENSRTLAAAEALRQSDLVAFGQLMKLSHVSLRDDYEVSCPELDAAVEVASQDHAVYGARMTGGGFGGCTVTLLESAAVERVSTAIQKAFRERFDSEPALFSTRAEDGARED